MKYDGEGDILIEKAAEIFEHINYNEDERERYYSEKEIQDQINEIKHEYETGNLDNIDEEKWGDFLLVLEINRSTFNRNLTFPVKLYFRNTGMKTIILDGILPFRQSANPPYINIWSSDNIYYQINSVSDGLLNDKKIIIEPEKQVVLIQGDLTQISGTIYHMDSTGVSFEPEQVDNLGSMIEPGTYKIQGHFHPTPQIYYSDTDTIMFIVQ